MSNELHNQLDVLMETAKELNCNADWSQAQTGTIYLTITWNVCDNCPASDDVCCCALEDETSPFYSPAMIEKDGTEIKVRIADHGECYCTEDHSVDPCGINVNQMIQIIKDTFKF